jgi:predicted O-methyltransferase YrrM
MKTVNMTPELFSYVTKHCPKVNDVLDSVRDYTAKIPWSQMQIGHDQGAFMATIVKTLRASRVLEIGCFTGYSTSMSARNTRMLPSSFLPPLASIKESKYALVPRWNPCKL